MPPIKALRPLYHVVIYRIINDLWYMEILTFLSKNNAPGNVGAYDMQEVNPVITFLHCNAILNEKN